MRLHDKVGALLDLRPDVAVLPECACPEALLRRSPEILPSSLAWTGPNPAKGLAVLAFGAWSVSVESGHNGKAATAMPLRIAGPRALRLLAVRALPPWARRQWDRVPEPLPDAVERSRRFLARPPAVLVGDFHQTLVRATREGPVSSPFARRLEQAGFTSACRDATYFPYRKPHRGYLTDHVFLDASLSPKVRRAETGTSHWLSVSDHLPVLVDLELE
jgi:hypothetical protein